MIPQSPRQPKLSCNACKDRKRKCDRGLPKCSLCSRRNLICEYPTRRRRELSQSQTQSQNYPSPQSSIAASTSASQIPIANSALSPPTSEFPPVFYLDNAVFQNSLVSKPFPISPIPLSITSLIGDTSNWSSVAATYFKTVHTWMPIVSKKRFFENVPINDIAQSPLRSDYALLILCMELSTWMPRSQNPRTKAYLAAKSFYLDLEIQGIVTIQLLQALILIAFYETGHAIFPSAAVSVEACVRYGQALGINWQAKSAEKKPFAWVDREEQNRVWWAVFMLECVSRIGYPRSPPLVESPSPEVHLPSSTTAWDEGVMPSKNLTILQPRSNQDLGPFATMAEATRLLSRVLEHVAVQAVDEQHSEEAIILDRALKALESVVEHEGDYNRLSIMNQTTMCSISLIILHEHHASKKSSASDYFQTIHHSKHITNDVSISQEEFTRSLTDIAPIHSCVREASPFLTTLLYQAAIANLRLDQETRSEESSKALHTMKSALAEFDNRWKASGAYLRILEAREVSAM
ncbi:hypothetical protein BKA64DRAFT_96909 [Cadophora sp. MPI-SDFR-AT-0126]|nr:hypothetical protein BKA64DRAFT_96909 [Leotiomycetes sp. MPI-SDFR-AT-0126]